MDTERFVVYVKTVDIYADIINNLEIIFSTLNYK